MNFYLNFVKHKSDILYTGIENGKKILKKIKYKPSLFVKSSNEKTKWQTPWGDYVSKMSFNSMYEADEFIKTYNDIDNFHVFGNDRYQYAFISDYFPNSVKYDQSKIKILNIDIEVDSSDGMPDVVNPKDEIISIAMKCDGKTYVYGFKEYNNDNESVIYFKADDEVHLLRKFVGDWRMLSPDIITGWYVNLFDIPYLVNRIEVVLGSSFSKRLSPWDIVKKRHATVNGRENTIIDIVGCSILDYIELYKKYAPVKNRPSYKLDYIAHVELGEKKLPYQEYSSLNELYEKDFQKFIDYNIKDVDLVDKLEKKMQLISLILSVAYQAKVNFTDVYTQVRMWDCIIFNDFRKKNLVLPPKQIHDKDEKYEGAFVKEPIPGFYNWIVSFDVNSQYPNLIMWANISPETIIEGKHIKIDIEKLINKEYDLKYLKSENITLAANGQHFSRDKIGFLPEIISDMMDNRVQSKKKMLYWENVLEKIQNELKTRGL
jgi:DNA polymerase elongation subunit (family B)